MTGKDTCKYLKDIRRQIAKENGIELHIPPCTYKGPCAGTCPQCENEMRHLEHELAKHISIGKAATVAGIAMTLAVPAMAQTPSHPYPAVNEAATHPHQPIDDTIRVEGIVPQQLNDTIKGFTIRGTVKEQTSQEPVPFATVVLEKDGTPLSATRTDMDGKFVINDMPDGNYEMWIKCVGYRAYMQSINIQKSNAFNIEIEPSFTPIPMMGIITGPSLFEMGGYGSTQTIEAGGLTVKAQY